MKFIYLFIFSKNLILIGALHSKKMMEHGKEMMMEKSLITSHSVYVTIEMVLDHKEVTLEGKKF
jgi:hypothetical protein